MLFVDTALLFGLKSAPKIFMAVADANEWMLKQDGVCPIMLIPAPTPFQFLLIGAPDGQDCACSLNTFLTASWGWCSNCMGEA